MSSADIDGYSESIKRRARQYVAQLLVGCGDQKCRNRICYTGRCNSTTAPVRKHTPRSARAVALCMLYAPSRTANLCWHGDPPDRFDDGDSEELKFDPYNLLQHLANTADVLQLTGFRHGVTSGVAELGDTLIKGRSALARCRQRPYLAQGRKNPLFIDDQVAVKLLSNTVATLTSDAAIVGLGLSPNEDHQANLALLSYVRHIMCRHNSYVPQERSAAEPFEVTSSLHDATDRLRHHELAPLAKELFETIACRSLLDDVHDTTIRHSRATHRFLDLLIVNLSHQIETTPTPALTWCLLDLFGIAVWSTTWDGVSILKRGTPTCGLLELADRLHVTSPSDEPHLSMPLQSLPLRSTSMAPLEVMSHFREHEQVSMIESYHILQFQNLFGDQDQLLRLLWRTLARQNMQESQVRATAGDAVMLEMFTSQYTMPGDLRPAAKTLNPTFFILDIKREHVMEDAFDQLYRRHDFEFRKPLRVLLREYDDVAMGQDLGGVQVEFFNMVFAALLNEESGFFTTHVQSGLTYPRPGSLQPLYMFEYIGILLALALYNCIAVPVSFPLAFYRHLIGLEVNTLKHIQDLWSTESRSLGQITDSPVDGLELDYAYSFEVNGLRLTMSKPKSLERDNDLISTPNSSEPDGGQTSIRKTREPDSDPNPMPQVNGMPMDQQFATGPTMTDSSAPSSIDRTLCWHGMEIELATPSDMLDVTETNKHAFVQDYIRCMTYWSVRPQLDAIKAGFNRVLSPYQVSFLSAQAMQKILEGTTEVNVQDLREHTSYVDYTPDDPYIEHFWTMLKSWSNDRRRALIRFVTAADRLPASGAAMLTFKLYEVQLVPGEMRLPTSSTCFGTLYLPRYESTDVMESMVNKALDLGEQGFGNR